MNDEVKIRIHITKGSLVLAELHSTIDGGRHEFTFSQPINVQGRHFDGFAVECYLDRETRHVVYDKRREIELPGVPRK